MDYRSLAILSRCIQAPIPYLKKPDQSSPLPADDTVAPLSRAPVTGHLSTAVDTSQSSSAINSPTGIPHVVHGFSAQVHRGHMPQAPPHSANSSLLAAQNAGPMHNAPNASTRTHSNDDDDDFADFQAAPVNSRPNLTNGS